jgi:saccharopine dehydrogenase (NAD+, L-lysine forming)
MLKIGIIQEGKIPRDTRVAITPRQAAFIKRNFAVGIVVEPSGHRCFSDEEYLAEGIEINPDLSGCDILLGVKEVPIGQLMADKTYFFFSHTIKKQPYNRDLLRSVLKNRITLLDYEVLTDEHGKRLIAFGRYAGMVGAHNGLLAFGIRTGEYSLPRMKDMHDYSVVRDLYTKIKFPPIRAVLTGTGRVSTGSAWVLKDAGFKQISHNDYLTKKYDCPVFTQLSGAEYAERKDGKTYQREDFYLHPEKYKSVFSPYLPITDIFFNGIFYEKKAPAFFTLEEMQYPSFKIKTIADITCDIIPDSSIPCTIRATTIADPFFGYDPDTHQEVAPFQENSIDMMTIDNLPNELPRDASEFFSEQFILNILPELMNLEDSPILARATICEKGVLTSPFEYLRDYVS